MTVFLFTLQQQTHCTELVISNPHSSVFCSVGIDAYFIASANYSSFQHVKVLSDANLEGARESHKGEVHLKLVVPELMLYL